MVSSRPRTLTCLLNLQLFQVTRRAPSQPSCSPLSHPCTDLSASPLCPAFRPCWNLPASPPPLWLPWPPRSLSALDPGPASAPSALHSASGSPPVSQRPSLPRPLFSASFCDARLMLREPHPYPPVLPGLGPSCPPSAGGYG